MINKRSNIKKQLKIIRKAYDKTVDNHNKGIDDEDLLPKKFKTSERYKRLKNILNIESCSSGDSKIKKYLNPKSGMKFLDVGSCANLINTKLYQWPSIYYGIDISPKLIRVTQNFVKRNKIVIGGLYVAEVAKIPFKNNFFDICAIIGVLEYFDISYIKKALKELHRVMKSQGKIVFDMPNMKHSEISTAIEFEEYLGRPRYNLPSNEEFEIELKKLFSIDKIDDSKIMTIYFTRVNK